MINLDYNAVNRLRNITGYSPIDEFPQNIKDFALIATQIVDGIEELNRNIENIEKSLERLINERESMQEEV